MTDALRTAAEALLKTWDRSFGPAADLEGDMVALRAALAEARQPAGEVLAAQLELATTYLRWRRCSASDAELEAALAKMEALEP